jgi:hypothetical protein
MTARQRKDEAMTTDCIAADPCKPGEKRIHREAREVHDSQRNGWPGGDVVTYECPHCKQRFEIELPQ